MDWPALAFDWNRTRAFLVTAEEGSLSAAARALGMAQPTLGRQVAALEAELGVALFARTGRGLALTAAGVELLEHVREMGAAAGRVALAAGGRAQAIEGTIAITTSEIYAATLLPPVVARLRREAPGIEVEIVARNDTIDIRRREADIALRSARPSQPDLIAKRLGEDRARLYATPGYLGRIGRPDTPEAFAARAEIVGFDTGPRMAQGLAAMGLPVTAANFPVLTQSHLVQWELAKAGVAAAIVPEALGDAERAVERALPAFAPLGFDVWLVTHEELATSRRVRLVFDLMAEMLAPRFRIG